jgi:hypothetical protein
MTTILPDRTVSMYRPAPVINSVDQLNGLTQLEGVPISVIEDRARPGRWSQTGFLAPQDRFNEVLKKDWKAVTALDLTHLEIAEHLDQIIEKSFPKRGGGYGEYKEEIVYDFSQIQNAHVPNLIAALKTQKNVFERFFDSISLQSKTIFKTSGIYAKIKVFFESFAIVFQNTFNPPLAQSIIHVECGCYSGHQEDIFGDRQWSRDYVFTNQETGESITVDEGVIHYIRKYGFYEGNVPHRVDPIRLISVLTGIKAVDLEAHIASKSSS